MGDVSIFIDKNGNVIDLSKKKNNTDTNTNDNEDEDDIDEDELSGSGSASLPTTLEFTTTETSTPIQQKIKDEGGDSGNVAIIAAAVSCAVILLVVVIVIIVCLRRRRRKQREKSVSKKPLPHPASMDVSESSRSTLAVRPTGDGYYAPSAPIYHPSGSGEDLPPPIEPPPPPPTSKKSLNQSKPAKSARYTKLNTAPGGPDKSENIYETIDDYAVGGVDDGEVYLMGVNLKAEGGDGDHELPSKETDKLEC